MRSTSKGEWRFFLTTPGTAQIYDTSHAGEVKVLEKPEPAQQADEKSQAEGETLERRELELGIRSEGQVARHYSDR